ncbi:MAG: NAD(P)H-hydrate dehydratase [Edaphobacter sp.]|nr:NAD(P)H-hydrate dehydratase [Edaphobacter sp.]MDE1176203.1 NAD(P)H-hydrate dehydratase [Edaphobacter sp.]
MKILTAEEMGAADRRTAEQAGIPMAQLMDAAGTAVAAFCLRRFPDVRSIVALCGKGNNGGDGVVAARVLAARGITARVVLLGSSADVKGDAAGALDQLRRETPQVAITEVFTEEELAAAIHAQPADLLLDAVVGTGFKPPLRGLAEAARKLIAEMATPVVSVDLPSGWNADSLEQTGDGAYRSNAVVTFTAPKRAHIFGYLTPGPVVVAPIGSPDSVVLSGANLYWTGSSKTIAEKPRDANSNKGKYGHVLLIGGSYGTAGAPSMSSLAAMRTGAGLVTAAVPKSVVDLVAGIAPELMVKPLEEGPEGAIALSNVQGAQLEKLIERMSVLAIGPGLSQRGEASAAVRELIARTKLPAVIDADGLNAFAGATDLLDGSGRTLVLTPHPGEMARLAGMTVKEVEADRIGLARSFATKHKLTLVLKGWRTLVAHPDGSIGVNTTGNPAMSKGGSGDILTGIVAAMLAQFPDDVARAVETAVYLHGLAADFAAREMDEHTVLATDTVAHLSNGFRYRVRDEDNLTWLCGLR